MAHDPPLSNHCTCKGNGDFTSTMFTQVIGRHIYDWNIVNCDVKQPIHIKFTSPKLLSGSGEVLTDDEWTDGAWSQYI